MSLHDEYDALAAHTRQSPWLDERDVHITPWREHELDVNETLVARLLRKPTPDTFCGDLVFVGTPDEVIALKATAKTGHTLLERELKKVEIGDMIEITLRGMKTIRNGDRQYRHCEVNRLDP